MSFGVSPNKIEMGGIATFNRALLIVRHMGLRWCLFRARYALAKRLGWMARMCPSREWEQIAEKEYLPEELHASEAYLKHRQERAPHFFFSVTDRSEWAARLSKWGGNVVGDPVNQAEEIRAGRFSLFSGPAKEAGFPPNWHVNQITGERAPSHLHWSGLSDFGFGDIKNIWELNRFAFTYDLVRAYWRTGDGTHAETFWLLFEDWLEKNPPQRGVNWKCGQEIALRLMAWSFALYGFGDAKATTPERVARFGKAVYVSAARIEANLKYALSQESNHGHSEALGLYLAGVLYPELTGSGRWRKRGKALLEELAEDLNYADGNSCMNSMNYQRMMMEALAWAVRLGELNGDPLRTVVKERIAAGAEFFFQCQDRTTGRVPNYGSNDGALTFPVASCNYRDYRPIVQLLTVLATGRRVYGAGPWDETVLWMLGNDGLRTPMDEKARKDFVSEPSGFYVLRSEDVFAFTRCGSHRHRPGHADMLHVDLWWKGRNIAIDPGSFSYNGREPFDNVLKKTRFHNTVTVDECDQMDSMGKFLWVPWVTGCLLGRGTVANGRMRYLIGEHSGYNRLSSPVTHQRSLVFFEKDTILVLDRMRGKEKHQYNLQWLLGDFCWDSAGEDRLELKDPAGATLGLTWGSSVPWEKSVVRAEENGPRGWTSEYYQQLTPALSLSIANRGEEVWFWSVFSEREVRLTLRENLLSGSIGDQSVSFLLASPSESDPVSSVKLAGSLYSLSPSVESHRT